MKVTQQFKTKLMFPAATLTAVALFSPFAIKAEDKISETITITESRAAQSMKEVSRSIAQISTQEIEKVQVDHIQQVINQTAGVNVHRNSGQEMLLAIRSPVLTGAGSCGSFLTLENGIALRPNGFCNVNELFESHFEMADNIEIVKGPSSEFYGNNGLHGAINIINPASLTRAPFVKTSFGEWDYQQLAVLFNTDNTAISSTISSSGGFRDASGFDQQKLSVTHNTQLQGIELDSFLTVTNLSQETAGYITGLDSYKDENVRLTNPNPEAYRDATAIRVSQRYQFDTGLVVSPYVRHSNMEFLQHFVPGKPVEKNEQTSFGVQSQYTLVNTEFNNVNIGVDMEMASTSLLEEQFAATLGSSFLVATIPQGKHYDYQVDITTLAGFASWHHDINNQLKLNSGIRVETINFEYDNQMVSGRVDEDGNTCGFGGCRFNRPESRSDRFTIVSPKLGLVYQASKDHTAYVNLSHGFRAPQATELYRLQREQEVSDLDAEELLAFDAGIRSQIGQTQVSLEGFWYDKSNVILRNSDFFYVSNGETQHKGIELSVTSTLTDDINVRSNVSYAQHTYENNPNLSSEDVVGNDIDTAPNWLANGFINYQLADWTIQLHGQYVGEYYLNPENTSSYDGHTLWHANAKYTLSERLSLQINIDNVFDKKYAERADFTSFTAERYFPGKPRNIKVTVKYNL